MPAERLLACWEKSAAVYRRLVETARAMQRSLVAARHQELDALAKQAHHLLDQLQPLEREQRQLAALLAGGAAGLPAAVEARLAPERRPRLKAVVAELEQWSAELKRLGAENMALAGQGLQFVDATPDAFRRSASPGYGAAGNV